MVEDRIGYRYAKALFDRATEIGDIEASRKDMEFIRATIAENRDLALFFKSPLVSSGRKQKIVDKIFAGQFEGKSTEKLVEMIVRKRREMYLPQVADAFLMLYDKQQKIQRGVLTSAVPLSKEQVLQIKSQMEKQTGNRFELVEAVNSDLIGGFTLEIGDTLFDGSVSGTVRRLKQQLID